jgi:hypothetical protein
MTVIDINDHKPPPPPPPGPYHERANDLILQCIADWRIGRAEQQIEWATNWLATKGGDLPDGELTHTHAGLDKMRDCEDRLALMKPYDMFAARALMEVAVEILGHHPAACFRRWPSARNLEQCFGLTRMGTARDTNLQPEARARRITPGTKQRYTS